jgi:hypothetical protein
MHKPMSLPPQRDGKPFETLDNLVRAVVAVPKSAIDNEGKRWKRAKAREKKQA